MDYVDIAVALQVKCKRDKGRKRRRTSVATIYALYDERDHGVRYVGVTRGPLYLRLDRHRKDPTSLDMGKWLRECGERVRVEALEVVRHDEWESAERGWIHWFRERGQLLNIDPGGEYRDSSGAPRALVLLDYLPPKDDENNQPARSLTTEEIADAFPGVRVRRVRRTPGAELAWKARRR